MYVYIHICIYIIMYVYIHTYVRVHLCEYIHVRIYGLDRGRGHRTLVLSSPNPSSGKVQGLLFWLFKGGFKVSSGIV